MKFFSSIRESQQSIAADLSSRDGSAIKIKYNSAVNFTISLFTSFYYTQCSAASWFTTTCVGHIRRPFRSARRKYDNNQFVVDSK